MREPHGADPEPTGPGRRRLLSIGVAAAAALAGLGVAWWRQSGAPTSADAAAAAAAAAAASDPLDRLWSLSLARPEGGELALVTLRGKPLLINFWAT